jgi:Tol biopolymer transport system component
VSIRARLVAAVALVTCCAAHAGAATLFDPLLRFRVVATPHFRIYLHQNGDRLAARLAAIAESTWLTLERPLGVRPPPLTHVVLADQTDLSNGYATPLPYDTIVIYTVWPPGAEFDVDDWLRLVFTHEFTHIVHLDRSRGWARAVRGVFGRTAVSFPNLFLPTWQIEGLATYEESAITGEGRLHAGDFRAVTDEAARQRALEPLDRVNGGLTDWPSGQAAYAYGVAFHQYLVDRFGAEKLAALADATAGRVPYTASPMFRTVYGESLGDLWRDFERTAAANPSPPAADPAITRLTTHGFVAAGPRFDRSGCATCPPAIVYTKRTPDAFPSLVRITGDGGSSTDLATRYFGATTAQGRDEIYFDQLEVRRNVGLYGDLFALSRATGRVRQITHGARLHDPDLSPDGTTLVCVQDRMGQRDLVLVRLKADTTQARADADVVSGSSRTQQARSDADVVSGLSRTQQAGSDTDVVSGFSRTQQARSDADVVSGSSRTQQARSDPDVVSGLSRTQQAGSDTDVVSGFSRTQQAGSDTDVVSGFSRTQHAGSDADVVSGFSRTPSVDVLVSEPDTQFNAPRWSPDGRLIAVERHRMGADPDIVVVDPATRTVRSIARAAKTRIVMPAWRPDGRAIVAAAAPGDRVFNLVELSLDRSTPPRQLTRTTGGATWPEISPDGRTLIFVGYTIDGSDLFSMPYPDAADAAAAVELALDSPAADRTSTEPASDSAIAAPARYSPLPTLKPTSWSPVVEWTSDQIRVGAATDGRDVLGYHGYAASATWLVSSPAGAVTPSAAMPDWFASYAYDRWRPTLFAAASSETSFFAGPATDAGTPSSATRRERVGEGGVILPFVHARVSHTALATVFRAMDDYTLADRDFTRTRSALRAAWRTQTARTYGYSISPEDGVTVGGTAEVVDRALGASADATTFTVDARAFLPAFARHHVLAARFAGGRSTGDPVVGRTFVLGGAAPDTSVIDFGSGAASLLRGFESNSFAGSRVALANVEYRWPIARPQRGIGTWPLFLHTVHAAAFADAGHAWTRTFHASAVKTSVGAELSANVVVGFYFPITLTMGVAWGHDGSGTNPGGTIVYFRTGKSF